MHHDQVGFISDMQCWVSILKTSQCNPKEESDGLIYQYRKKHLTKFNSQSGEKIFLNHIADKY